MNRTCFGITDNYERCKNNIESSLYCNEHLSQKNVAGKCSRMCRILLVSNRIALSREERVSTVYDVCDFLVTNKEYIDNYPRLKKTITERLKYLDNTEPENLEKYIIFFGGEIDEMTFAKKTQFNFIDPKNLKIVL